MRPLHALLPLAAVLTLSAQDVVAPRMTIFLPERVIRDSARGRKIFSELEALKKTLEEKLQAKGLEGQKVQAQLQSPSISDAGREQLTKQYRDLEFEFKKMNEDSQADYAKVQQKVFATFQTEIKPIVDGLAKEQKLQLVLQYQQGLVVFAEEPWVLRFTDEVTKRYDAKYEGAASAAAEKPAPKPSGKPAPKK
jgi:Skp family chaperone for outer membrane proteins